MFQNTYLNVTADEAESFERVEVPEVEGADTFPPPPDSPDAQAGNSAFVYSNQEKEELALEAINKIKAELLYTPPPNSFGSTGHYENINGGIWMKLAGLGTLLEWRERYMSTLGRIKSFLTTHPICKEEFEVMTDSLNPILFYVRSRKRMVELPYLNTMQRYASDELSVVDDSSVHEANTISYSQEEALQCLKEILLREGGTQYRMRLSMLNLRSRWSQTFGVAFGSMKQWIRYLNDRGFSDITINSAYGPGNDEVQYHFSNGNQVPSQPLHSSTAASVNAPQSNSQFPHPAFSDNRIGVPYFPSLIKDVVIGVRVSDFFFLPAPTDVIEISYRRCMGLNTDLVKTWCERGIVTHCWQYDSDQFKKFEWYGDTVLRSEISKTLLLHSSTLFDISGLDSRRQNAEQRLTLSLLFDELKLAQFVVVCPASWTAQKWKAKCDILEALIGELMIKLQDPSEHGIPFGHPQRENIQRFVRTVCEAALERGSHMKSPNIRTEIENDARRPGSGGFLMEELDRAALERQRF